MLFLVFSLSSPYTPVFLMSYSFKTKLLLGCTLALLLTLVAINQAVTIPGMLLPLTLVYLLFRAGGEIMARVKAENALARKRDEIMTDSLALIYVFMPWEKHELWEGTMGNVHQVREKVRISRERARDPLQESYAQAMERLAQELRTEEAHAEILRLSGETWNALIRTWIDELQSELPHLLTLAMPPDTDQRPMTRELRQQLEAYQAELPGRLGEARRRLAVDLRHCDGWEPICQFMSDLKFRVVIAQDWARTA